MPIEQSSLPEPYPVETRQDSHFPEPPEPSRSPKGYVGLDPKALSCEGKNKKEIDLLQAIICPKY